MNIHTLNTNSTPPPMTTRSMSARSPHATPPSQPRNAANLSAASINDRHLSVRELGLSGRRRAMGLRRVGPRVKVGGACRGRLLLHTHAHQRAKEHNDHEAPQQHRQLHAGVDVALDAAVSLLAGAHPALPHVLAACTRTLALETRGRIRRVNRPVATLCPVRRLPRPVERL